MYHRLHFPSCHNFSTSALVNLITQSCPALTSLDLSDCPQITDDSLVPIIHATPGLHRLCVEGCHRLTDRFLHALAGEEENNHIQQQSSGAANKNNNHFTFSRPRKLPSRLTELQASHLPHVTDRGLRALIESQVGLTHLHLQGCPRLTVEAFCHEQVLTSGLVLQRNFKVLNLSSCPALVPNVIYW